MKPTLLVALGTRPEAIKLAPLIQYLRRNDGKFLTVVCSTGQHKELLQTALANFQICPDYDLKAFEKINNDGITSLGGFIIDEFSKIIKEVKPTTVIVQGDTISAFSCGFSAFLNHIPVCHIEAGLRSFNHEEPFPEEVLRVMISDFASYHFAPHQPARDALLQQGIAHNNIFVVGNIVSDAVAETIADIYRSPRNNFASIQMLVTVHRRENIGNRLVCIIKAIRNLVELHPDLIVVIVLHPNPQVSTTFINELSNLSRVTLLSPQPYHDFLSLMVNSDLILTDSGGVSEEASLLGIPLFIARETTERKYLLDKDNVFLTGTETSNVQNLISNFLLYQKNNLQEKRIPKIKEYKVSIKIAKILLSKVIPELVCENEP